MDMHHVRRGAGKPLLLLHGLGGTWRSWTPVLDALAAEREVIAVDLPGFGETPPLPSPVTFDSLADAVTKFIEAQGLTGVDVVGSSMGARLVLELARRGVVGAVVSLDPGGFWRGWQRLFFWATIDLSIRLVRLLQPLMPAITRNPLARTLCFVQLSAHPWRLPADVMLAEMRGYAAARSFDELLRDLATGPTQEGPPRGSLTKPMVIGWGRRDRICLRSQSKLAMERFPDARLHWFQHSGHFPMFDEPSATVRLILDTTR